MNDSIQILNKNGDMMSVEGIAHVVISDLNKKYLFYTLNEKVDNDLTKIYIAEASDVQGGANPINDDEWNNIRKKMVKISHKEELPEVSYLPFGENTVNVGEAKKLAVTSVAKQAFKEAQATHTISTNQTETPVVSSTPSFFAAPTEESNEGSNVDGGTPNIFANPPTPVPTEPVVVTNEVTQVGTPALTQAPVTVEAVVPQQQTEVNSVPGIAESAPQVTTTTVNPTPEIINTAAIPTEIPTNGAVQTEQIVQPSPKVVETIPAPAENQAAPVQVSTEAPAIGPTESVAAAPIAPIVGEEQKLDQSGIAQAEQTLTQNLTTTTSSEQINSNEQKDIISDEDALKAIEVIQDYIAQEEAA